MTRNREIDCLDLFYCQHDPEIPVCDEDGIVVEWRCRCGQVVPTTRKEDNRHVSDEQHCGLEGRSQDGRRT